MSYRIRHIRKPKFQSRECISCLFDPADTVKNVALTFTIDLTYSGTIPPVLPDNPLYIRRPIGLFYG